MQSLSRYVRIIVVVLIMATVVYHVGERLRERSSATADGDVGPAEHHGHQTTADILKSESGPFSRRPVSVGYGAPPRTDAGIRSLDVVYQRRAYPGAPPVIPHEVDADNNRRQQCNVCHEQGGFVPRFNAYTPITPHPEFGNCLQCHVQSLEEDLFIAINWTSVRPPLVHRPALPGSPPPIPHGLQLRENCLACHAGNAAPLEIRTTHPERVNCRQCHVPRESDKEFERPRPAARI